MPSERDTTVPISARVTRDLLAEIDRFADECRMTRGNVVMLMLAASVMHQDELFATYRNLLDRRRGDRP